MVETMRWEQGSLVLLDQTLLPQKIEWITCVDYKRVKVAIERLEVRVAPAIGAAAAFAMVLVRARLRTSLTFWVRWTLCAQI